MNSFEDRTGNEIAVIGMACRFPGARNTHEFWDNLKNSVESIVFATAEEMRELGVGDNLLEDPNYVKTKGGVLADHDYFDAAFFDYSPTEAELMDPQMRLLHECAWDTLENGGYAPTMSKSLIGLYAGASSSFNWAALCHLSGKNDAIGTFSALQLQDKDFLCTRIAYRLNLQGPALIVQTTCSTSLVAIHLACQGILDGECDMALAGGVSIDLQQEFGYVYQEGMIYSPDGHCRAFDAEAKGCVEGNGVGLVLLKTMEDAIADGDHIHAVIKGSAINSDGCLQKAGYTAPSRLGQTRAIRFAHQVAEVEPESITYVETHGTGTVLGDPIEAEALKRAFKTDKKKYCAIGAVKTNIGHLDAAAGVAGFIKTVLALQNKQIPPSLNFKTPNPKIDFENSPFYVAAALKDWEPDGFPRRAGVSSFGIGGANAHVVLEEAPPPGAAEQAPPHHQSILVLSAKTESALQKSAENLADYFKHHTGAPLHDVAYTLQVGRKALPHRRVIICDNAEEAGELLLAPKAGKSISHHCKVENRYIAFMFSGLGGQYINMGRDLYREIPGFRREMNLCFDILKPLVGFDVKGLLYPGSTPPQPGLEKSPEELFHSDIVQPVVLAFEYALARLLMDWGIKPHGMIGYSFGEYTAACLAGVFSLEDALKLVVFRNRLIQKVPTGAMLSVPLPPEQLAPHLNDNVSLAIDNGPSGVVAGLPEDLSALEEKLKSERILCMPVPVSHGLHSKLMTPILDEFKKFVGTLTLAKPGIPYISNVSGDWVNPDEVIQPEYWGRHLGETVRFSSGIDRLVNKENALLIEVGPGRDITTLVTRYIENKPTHKVVNLVKEPRRESSDVSFLLNRVGRLWLWGAELDWRRFHPGKHPRRLPLPTYPFEGKPYRVEVDPSALAEGQSIQKGANSRRELSEWFYIPSWKRTRLPESFEPGSSQNNCWLVFMDEGRLGLPLVEELLQKKQRVITLSMGTGFVGKDALHFQVNPFDTGEGDYQALFDALEQDGNLPNHILHLWGLSGCEEHNSELTPDKAARARELGYYCLLKTARALGRKHRDEHVQISVITDNMHEIIGGDACFPEKTTVIGPVRTIPSEFPNITCRNIDIYIQPGMPPEKHLFPMALKALSVEGRDGPEPVIALRGNHCWIQTVEPIRLEKNTAVNPRLKDKGVYLITGGTGGIGLELAGFLAENAGAKLVLLGRSQFPPRETWEQQLESFDEQDPLAQKIRKIIALETAGAEVLVAGADVSDEEQLRKVIQDAIKNFGPIDGVIHAAGLADGLMIQRRESKHSEQLFASKITGTLLLDHLLEENPLDFTIYCSSVTSMLSIFGQVGYCAANNFIDAYAVYRTARRKSPTISINWDRWQSIGMAAQGEKEHIRLTGEALPEGMKAKEGIEAFRRILAGNIPQVAVSLYDLNSVIRQFRNLAAASLAQALEDTSTDSPIHERPDLDTEYITPQGETEEALAEIWSKFFGYREIGALDDFFELGGDSLKALTLTSMIHKRLSVELFMTDLFTHPTIRSTAEYIIHEARKTAFTSVEPVEKKEYYPLSSGQRRLYILNQMEPDNTHYNMPTLLSMGEDFNIDRLNLAFNRLVERHESLRASFVEVDEIPFQKLHDTIQFESEYYEAEKDRAANIVARFVRPFELDRPPLIRSALIRLPDNNNLWLTDMHHIISDGASQTILTRDFASFYEGKELAPLRIQYKDFSHWQHRWFQTDKFKDSEKFWLNRLSGDIPKLDLRTDYPRPKLQSFEGDFFTFVLNEGETETFKEMGAEKGATLFINLLTLLNVLLYKYTGQCDLIIGCDVSVRPHADLLGIIGMFINMLPIRSQIESSKSYNNFLMEVKQNCIDAFDNQEMPFEELVDKLDLERDPARNPLFDVEFVLQNYESPTTTISYELPKTEEEEDGIKLRNINNIFDISLEAEELKDKIIFTLRYCTKLFKRSTIQRMGTHYINMLTAASRTPGTAVSRLDILTPEERKQLLFDFNDTLREFPSDTSYPSLFAEQASRTPDRAAVEHNGHVFSYAELNSRAGCLARHLYHEKNIRPGSLVAIWMDRSIHFLVSILGIFKAGAAYVPIESSLPKDRAKMMIEDGRITVVISQRKYSPILEQLQEECECSHTHLLIDTPGDFESPADRAKEDASPLPPVGPDDFAYVIYTSGTTGKPKGAVIHHRGMINHIYAKINDLSMSRRDIIAQTASAGFDISVWQFLTALLVGASTYIFDKETILEHQNFLRLLQQKRITFLESVPSLMTVFLESIETEKKNGLDDLRWMIPTGETLPVPLARRWFRQYPHIKLVNAYGPTEASDDITHYIVETMPGENQSGIPVGKPLQNLHIYILDSDNSLCPIGGKGEICVAGAGVGKGYWNDTAKTEAVFIPNPFREEIGAPDYDVLYKTGDVGYFREDGNVECLGRLDYQVKIRGNRIELGEIERRLQSHESIKETVIVVREETKGNKYLCAYFVPWTSPAPPAPQLRDYLSGALPVYMIPSYFVSLEKMPLTANGKLNRKALPVPDAEAGGKTYNPPETAVQKEMVKIWADILGAAEQSISIGDNFFEMGGHSISATIVISRIHKALKVKIPLAQIFLTPTIRGLAECIEQASEDEFSSIEPVEKKEYYPMSAAHKRMYTLQALNKEDITYNIPMVMAMEDNTDENKIETIFKKMIERHESLRTSFVMLDERPVQRVRDTTAFSVESYQIVASEVNTVIKNFIRPFDLSAAPLFRVGLLRSDDGKQLLMVDVHHIITDGVSEAILTREFNLLYTGRELPRMKLQYKDFSEWQNRLLESGSINKQEKYWLERFTPPPTDLPLPYDYPPNSTTASGGGTEADFVLPSPMTRRLNTFVNQRGTTLYMLLLAVFNILLSRYTQREDIVVGSPITGRKHTDLQNIIGMFVNMLAMRNLPGKEKTFGQFFDEVKRNVLDAYENQDFQFDELVRKLGIGRESNHPPLFNAVLAMQNVETGGMQQNAGEEPIVDIQSHDFENDILRFNLTLFVSETDGHIACQFRYSSHLFKTTTIEKTGKHFVEIIEQVLDNPNIHLKEISLSSDLVFAGQDESEQEDDVDFVF